MMRDVIMTYLIIGELVAIPGIPLIGRIGKQHGIGVWYCALMLVTVFWPFIFLIGRMRP